MDRKWENHTVTVAPTKNHRYVVELCNQIVPGALPIRIPVIRVPDARVHEYFLNVRAKISRDGGTIQHGWAIWEVPGLFIEAEFYGVWLSPTGKWIDVTPNSYSISKILFLPDPKEIFDEFSLSRWDNIRLAQLNHPVVHEFIRHCAAKMSYIEESTNPNNPREVKLNAAQMEWFERRQFELQARMGALRPGRNDLCLCGSGEKFKKCCGAY